MREPLKDRDRLQHIVDAIDHIFLAMKDSDLDTLSDSKIEYYGIVKCIEIIGEAAYNLTHAFRDNHRETPWEQIIRMRHVLVHDYYKIKVDEVRYVIEDNLKPLRDQIAGYIAETDWKDWELNAPIARETAAHKTLIMMATRMKNKGFDIKEISRLTGLSQEEIESL